MIQTVVKRDGRTVGFNEQKIMAAIRKAMMHTDKGEDEQLIQRITDHITYHGNTQMPIATSAVSLARRKPATSSSKSSTSRTTM